MAYADPTRKTTIVDICFDLLGENADLQSKIDRAHLLFTILSQKFQNFTESLNLQEAMQIMQLMRVLIGKNTVDNFRAVGQCALLANEEAQNFAARRGLISTPEGLKSHTEEKDKLNKFVSTLEEIADSFFTGYNTLMKHFKKIEKRMAESLAMSTTSSEKE